MGLLCCFVVDFSAAFVAGLGSFLTGLSSRFAFFGSGAFLLDGDVAARFVAKASAPLRSEELEEDVVEDLFLVDVVGAAVGVEVAFDDDEGVFGVDLGVGVGADFASSPPSSRNRFGFLDSLDGLDGVGGDGAFFAGDFSVGAFFDACLAAGALVAAERLEGRPLIVEFLSNNFAISKAILKECKCC